MRQKINPAPFVVKRCGIKVLMATAELAPLAKVGGLADVVGSLPKELLKQKIDTRVILPFYALIKKKIGVGKAIDKITINFGDKKELANVYQTFIPNSKVILYLIDAPKYFKTEVYEGDSATKFLFFSKTVLEFLKNYNWQPNIIHCHDWHTAIIPALLKIQGIKKYKTLLTIHNLAMQGKIALKTYQLLGPGLEELPSFQKDSEDNYINTLAQGIINADLINTVSPTYAHEILTKEYGAGLEESLKKRKKYLTGILNGIDTEYFDPQKDKAITRNFNAKDFKNKAANKKSLQKICKLPQKPAIPLLGLVSRLTSQKGLDLLEEVLEKLMASDFQLVVLGTGQECYHQMFKKFAKKYSDKISANLLFNTKLAQQIYAGSDMFLMPSRFEPCGLGQMIAMRYGTIPIVRATGGLKDTVKENKNGFVFTKYSAGELLKTIKRAIEVYQNQKIWIKLIKNAMDQDFSWQKSAREYIKLYERLIKK